MVDDNNIVEISTDPLPQNDSEKNVTVEKMEISKPVEVEVVDCDEDEGLKKRNTKKRAVVEDDGDEVVVLEESVPIAKKTPVSPGKGSSVKKQKLDDGKD